MKNKPGRPLRDKKAATKQLQIRLTADRKSAYMLAAFPSNVSEWVCRVLDREARYKPEG